MLNSGQNRRFIVLCDLEIWRMTLKNNRAPLLCCFKLCASFHSHQWIQTKVTVRKRSIRVQIGDLLSRVTLKFDGWPWETIGHLFYVASRFMHHFIVIGEFKLKLQSGNAQFGSKSRAGVKYVLSNTNTTRQHSTQSVGNMPPPSPRHLLPHVLQIMPRNPKYDQFQPKGHHNEENPQSATKMPVNP